MAYLTSREDVDALRMPSPFFGDDPRGMVDRDALQAWSWGTNYDSDARRAAIAKALMAQEAARVMASAPLPGPTFTGGVGGGGASSVYPGGGGGGGDSGGAPGGSDRGGRAWGVRQWRWHRRRHWWRDRRRRPWRRWRPRHGRSWHGWPWWRHWWRPRCWRGWRGSGGQWCRGRERRRRPRRFCPGRRRPGR